MNDELIDLWERRAARKVWESNITKSLMSRINDITEYAVEKNDIVLKEKLILLVDVFDEWADMLEAEVADEALLTSYIANISGTLNMYNDVIAGMTMIENITFNTIVRNVLDRMKKD